MCLQSTPCGGQTTLTFLGRLDVLSARSVRNHPVCRLVAVRVKVESLGDDDGRAVLGPDEHLRGDDVPVRLLLVGRGREVVELGLVKVGFALLAGGFGGFRGGFIGGFIGAGLFSVRLRLRWGCPCCCPCPCSCSCSCCLMEIVERESCRDSDVVFGGWVLNIGKEV